MTEERKTELEIMKLEAEVSNAKLDRFFKPLQLATPLVLAIGVYLLVQQPQVDERESTSCIDQVKFVSELSEEKKPGVVELVLKDFPFQCDAARSMAQNILAEQRGQQALKDAEEALEAGQVLFQAAPPLGQLNQTSSVESLCQASPSIDSDLVKTTERLVSELSVARSEVAVALASAEQDIQDAMSGNDASGAPGCGPICRQRMPHSEELRSRLAELDEQLSERSNSLEQLRQLTTVSFLVCSAQ